MKLTTLFAVLSAVTLSGLAVSACQEVGHSYGPGDYGSISQDELWSGEIREVNTRRREINLRIDDGRTRTLTYDGNTRVVYRRSDYSVANLQRGDAVAVRVQDGPGRPYAERVRVRRSAQNRADAGDRLERLDGRVEYVNTPRGTFDVRDRGRTITVSMHLIPEETTRPDSVVCGPGIRSASKVTL